jgi:DNA modification methylase
MPVDLWREIIEIGSVEGESILEPFSGSGSCGVACTQLLRHYTGLELSEEYAQRSRMLIAEAQQAPVLPSADANVARVAKSAQPQVNLKDAFAALSFRS